VYVVVALVAASSPTSTAALTPQGQLPQITILPSPGVQTQLNNTTAEVIAHDLIAVQPAAATQAVSLHLEPGSDQNPPTAVAQVGSSTYRLHLDSSGVWALASAPPAQVAPVRQSSALAGERLTNVAPAVGLAFRQGSFRYGVSNDYTAMMGGGVCWLDYNNDGWQDLFAVNSYASADTAQWQAHGGLPTSQLFENVHGVFANVSAKTHANLAVQGDGCVAADLNGDGRTDLVVTTTSGVDILWNHGGTFTEQTLRASGWYTGAAVADVNGDGRPDLFVAGYSVPNEPVPNSLAGFPTNLYGVRDLLYLNEGNDHFREVGVQAGLEAADFRHGLGSQFVDVNGDGRPDLYVANDEDPNQLYINVPWPGGAAADPAGLGFRFEDRAPAERAADPFAGMGIAATNSSVFVTNSRGEPSAAYKRAGASFVNARPAYDQALGTGFAGWGASWVDVKNSGNPDLVLAAGAIPVTNLAKDAEPVQVLAPTAGGAYGNAKNIANLRLNGRGLAAADVDNNGQMQIAINTIGGRLALLRPSGTSGHWLDVALSRFAPGAVVTAVLPNGRTLTQVVTAGSSYLSSADPRMHFGLGAATSVRTLTVRYPFGGESVLRNVAANRIVEVKGPPPVFVASRQAPSPKLGSSCGTVYTPSIATIWDETAVAVLRAGGASEPVQARDLYDVSVAMWQAWSQTHDSAAVSYAAYRLLLWRASFNSNLATTFGLLTTQMRKLCYSTDYVATTGSPAAVGNRIAATAISAGMHDGSSESLHYADPAYTPENAPLIVAQSGSTVHDATFWQPLALAQVSPQGGGAVPAQVQKFVDPQWGRVKTFAGVVKAVAPPFADPTSPAYTSAAIAVLRAATSGKTVDTSPLAWNELATTLVPGTTAGDLRLYLTLNGALNDAAVSTWRAKREYQAPRPISMIRYLAFNNALPLVPGLTKRVNGQTLVQSQGRWVAGAKWTPSAATPASPGGVSEASAFAYAADAVLTKLTGQSFTGKTARFATAGLGEGIETPSDETAGRAVGTTAGTQALARARALFR
jgi:hypothetical protein